MYKIKITKKILLGLVFVFSFYFAPSVNASGGFQAYSPGDLVTTCGEFPFSGTYHITSFDATNSLNASSTCFVVSAPNVVLTATSSVSVSATGGTLAVDSRDNLNTNSGNAFGVEIRNIAFSGFQKGINANGKDANVGVGGSGSGTDAGAVTVSSSTLASIDASGGNGFDAGGNGATTTVTNSIIAGPINAKGGYSGGDYNVTAGGSGDGGYGGVVSITNSTITDVYANGGDGNNGGSIFGIANPNNAGSGGKIQVVNSNVGTTTSQGGNGGAGGYIAEQYWGVFYGGWGQGGNGGEIDISNSTASGVSAPGGNGTGVSETDYRNDNGGNGGPVTIDNSSVANISVNGGWGDYDYFDTTNWGSDGTGGAGGSVSVVNGSHALDISSNGGYGGTLGSSGGSVSVSDSQVSDISSNGGESWGDNTGNDGGLINISHSTTGNISGDSLNSYYGLPIDSGSTMHISNSTTGSVLGKDITITNPVTLSNISITSNDGGASSVVISYSGTVDHTDIVLGHLGSLTINGTVYADYPGGGWPLTPGSIDSCGVMMSSGSYSLSTNVNAGLNSCFKLLADNITINGNGKTITGNSTDYAIVATRTNGTTTIQNLTVTGFMGGVNASGGGSVIVSTSTTGSILGKNITINNPVTLANTSIASNDAGSSLVKISYSGVVDHTNISFSPLSSLNINGFVYTDYPGGGWPITPGSIDSCGVMMSPGVYTLSTNITTSLNTCFKLAADNITINGNGKTITGNSTDYAIVATRTNGTTTIQNLTITGFTGGVNANASNSNIDNSTADTGGSVVVTGSSLGDISSNGGDIANPSQFPGGQWTLHGHGGVGGNVQVLSNSRVGNIYANGGMGYAHNQNEVVSGVFGGAGGSVSVATSTLAGNINANGGSIKAENSGQAGTVFAGPGGNVNVVNSNLLASSTLGNIYAEGGQGQFYACGANGGNINVVSSSFGDASVKGRWGSGAEGGSGGIISIFSSNARNINISGEVIGYATNGHGNGGVLNLMSSTVSGNVSGDGASSFVIGGTGATVNATSSSIHGSISVNGG